MFASNISREEVNSLPKGEFQGDIYVIENNKDVPRIMPLLSEKNLLGFDTETKPAFRKGTGNRTALIQMASAEQCFLFRINRSGMHPSLIRILSDSGIKKIGLALKDDLKSLTKMYSFSPAGFTDLQQYVGSYGIESKGLRKLAAIVLGLRISKSQQTSNWEKNILTEKQIRYAATDAWVCREIWCKLNNHCSGQQ